MRNPLLFCLLQTEGIKFIFTGTAVRYTLSNTLSMASRYRAAMVLAGVGDSIGYYSNIWEFNFSGPDIHRELAAMGGLAKLKNKCKLL